MNPSDHDSSLLGRVFDQYQNMMQIGRCVREAARQRGVRRPRLLELSRRATGLADFVPELDLVRYPTHLDDQPTLSHPVTIPFSDKSFDACLVTDAYEHIASEQRPELLREMIRVTHGIVLLASPVETELTTRFDKIAFDFVWGKFAERFEPLDQHVEFGLEPLEHVLDSLLACGADRVITLPQNFVYRWIHQLLIYFDLQHRQPFADVYAPLNRVYNEYVAPFDYREPCYRYLIVGATDPGLNIEVFERALQSRPETPATIAAAEGTMIEVFHAVQADGADRLRQAASEIDRLTAELRQFRLDYVAKEQVHAHAVAEVSRLNVRLSEVLTAYAAREAVHSGLADEIARLTAELRQVRLDYVAQEQVHAHAVAEVSRLNVRLSEMLTAYAAREKVHSGLADEIARLTAELRQVRLA